MYKHINDGNLLSPNQSGFHAEESCIKQLLSITYNIFHYFEKGMETRAFFDVSTAFEKVWHKGIVYKLCQYCLIEKLLTLLIGFLSSRK